MLTLYDTALSLNCYKVRLLLGLLGVTYRRESVDLRKQQHKSPAMLALNPLGQVPVLVAGPLALRESQALLIWIARKFGAAWLPSDPDQEAIVHAWLYNAAFELRIGPYDARLAKLAPGLCVNASAAKEHTAHALQIYEVRLQDRPWVALDHPTIADVAAFPALAHCGDGDIDLHAYPSIRAWLARFRKLDGFVALLD